MPVSVPEKTLEHWASQYLLLHYDAALWWPAFDEDVRVSQFPAIPGKLVRLEVKTATVKNKYSDPVIKVNLWQLQKYLRSDGPQPLYVFPRPRWKWILEEAAGPDVASLGFRGGGDLWFANWMFAITAADVANVMNVRAYGRSYDRGCVRQLVRFTSDGRARWGRHGQLAGPHLIPWEELWRKVATYGRDDFPQPIKFTVAQTFEEESRQVESVSTYQPEDIMRFVGVSDNVAGIQDVTRFNSAGVEYDESGIGGHRMAVYLPDKRLI